MKIGIIGCGWLGERVAKKLADENEIFATVRSEKRLHQLGDAGYQLFQLDFQNDAAEEVGAIFQSMDALIISLPVSKNRHSQKIFKNVSKFLGDYKKQIIFFSSVGVYPQDDGIYTEKSTENLNENIFAAENFYRKNFPQINILRFGGLMGDDRNFSKHFQNKPISDPETPVNHIHYQDIAEIVDLIIKNKIQGKLYNVVAPLHPTKQQVFDFQMKNLNSEVKTPNGGRLILGKLLEEEMKYPFLKPNPMKF